MTNSPMNDALEIFRVKVAESIALVKIMSQVQQLEAGAIWKAATSALEQVLNPGPDSLENISFNVSDLSNVFAGEGETISPDIKEGPKTPSRQGGRSHNKPTKVKRRKHDAVVTLPKGRKKKGSGRVDLVTMCTAEEQEKREDSHHRQSSLLDDAPIQVAEKERFLDTTRGMASKTNGTNKKAALTDSTPRRSSRKAKPSQIYSDYVFIKDPIVSAHSKDKDQMQEVEYGMPHSGTSHDPSDPLHDTALTYKSATSKDPSSFVRDAPHNESRLTPEVPLDGTRPEHVDHGYSSAPPASSPLLPDSPVLDVKVDTSGSTIIINICKQKPPVYQDSPKREPLAFKSKERKIESAALNSRKKMSEAKLKVLDSPTPARSNPVREKVGAEAGNARESKERKKGEEKQGEKRVASGPCTCPECGKNMTNGSNLKVHMRIHSGEKPYACKLCGKAFSTKPNMVRHEQTTHTTEKAWKCRECNKGFTEKKSLTIHMRSHTGEMPYECPYCKKSFRQTGTLQSHMHTHTGWKGHLCDFCGKSFRQKTQLRVHQNRHFGIRKHKCPICPKSFVSKGEMERHRFSHSGERAFLCTLCPKTFTRLQYLREHMNVHTNTTPYHCKVCGEAFHDLSSHSKHQKKHETQNAAVPLSVSQKGEGPMDNCVFFVDTSGNLLPHPVMDVNSTRGVDKPMGVNYLQIPTMVKEATAENFPKHVDHVLENSPSILEIHGSLAELQGRQEVPDPPYSHVASSIILKGNAIVQETHIPFTLQELELESQESVQTGNTSVADVHQGVLVAPTEGQHTPENGGLLGSTQYMIIPDCDVPVGACAEATSVDPPGEELQEKPSNE